MEQAYAFNTAHQVCLGSLLCLVGLPPFPPLNTERGLPRKSPLSSRVATFPSSQYRTGSPSLPSSFHPLSPPLTPLSLSPSLPPLYLSNPLFPLSFPSLPFPGALPLQRLGSQGERVSSASESGQRRAARRFLVHFRLKISHLVSTTGNRYHIRQLRNPAKSDTEFIGIT